MTRNPTVRYLSRTITIALLRLLFIVGLVFGPISFLDAQNPNVRPNPATASRWTVADIVRHLEEKNRERAEALEAYQGSRDYRIQYEGPLGNREAEMTVTVNYKAPGDKEFTVTSQKGSKFLFDHVLKGLLDGEKEAASVANQRKTALSSENYEFTLSGTENMPTGLQYILTVSPKTDYKYLYRGKIWVDATDFAVARIAAEPAKSPSFWVKRSEVNHRYEKVGDFWLPEQNRTESWIRLGGHALLSIDYKDYKITDHTALKPSDTAAQSMGN